jgi:multisubunit Na+/H+ antiporter MnhG subunit
MIDPPPSIRYLRMHAATLLGYLVAASAYIAVGVWEPRFLLSWAEGILFLMFALWVVPAVVQRIRRR